MSRRAHPGAAEHRRPCSDTSSRTFRDTVRAHAGRLNRLNVYPVPDGDTGTNMARTLDAVVAEMEPADPTSSMPTCDAISHGSLMGARGNSGVILSQILRGFDVDVEGVTPTSDGGTVRVRRGPARRPRPAPTRRCSSRSKARS